MRRLGIISKDGKVKSVEVVDLDTGERVTNIRRITIDIEAGKGFITAAVEFLGVELDVQVITQADESIQES